MTPLFFLSGSILYAGSSVASYTYDDFIYKFFLILILTESEAVSFTVVSGSFHSSAFSLSVFKCEYVALNVTPLPALYRIIPEMLSFLEDMDGLTGYV